MLDLLQGEKIEPGDPSLSQATKQQGRPEEGFALQIVLFHRSFSKNPKANMGMIASEVARAFASDDFGIKQILETLSEVEMNLFKKMDAELRTHWLIEKWGFAEEFEALEKEMTAAKLKEQLDASFKGLK